ncbi:Spy/CpxP family protein refolding chaperone [Methylocystis sp. ATCC 49242]|uniref:Spy/CpxP family protein refolding chaperone n=1 Tax=Methylocystis sp. ATCC 49242 TaxID=622637 RepID=UPI0001F86CA2|nr:Spy/CpxP family protein refolding chaperone [Methylocystis sp. ATCC 49242]
MTTQNRFLRGKCFTASAAALLLGAGLSIAQAQQAGDHAGMDHSKMDHSGHGAANAPIQWADPGKAQSGAAPETAAAPEAPKADAGKADEHSGHHGGMGGMKHDGGMGGMGGMGGGMSGMNHGGGGAGGGMGGMKHDGGMGGGMSGMSHGGGGMGGMMKNMMCGFTEHLEGRLAYLKAELKLTDEQASSWNTFAEGWRAAAQKASAKCAATDERMDHSKPPVLHKLSMMENHMVDHLDIVRAQKAAIEPFFTTLSDEQKKIASETMTSIMKVGMSMGGGGMGGMMGGMGGMMGGMGGMSHGGGGGGMGGMQH